ncbi:hypothetical protein EV143_10459 [Flavobacterium chryseum]|uniref:hypothetical protein n=1 Tax=Flavobacterium sp. P3160 TaxID=2512113 RepID=UPI00106098E4|nr:hypothetical protein [Flavobacterium sp. P3160]TDO77298.1 hypothetical protein EV143_10459 [Flavobacterium sp. P3160]
MEIDRDLVQEMINNSVGSEYVIHEFIDSSKYLFITYKHRDFYADDERGQLIGAGPIVYHKETKEYKTSGSGDFVCGEYFGYLNENDDYVEKQWSVEEIKNDIVRRKFVNEDDIWNLALLFIGENGDSGSMTKNRNYNLLLHNIYRSDNTEVILYFEELWIELDLKYEVLNPNQILLWKNM